MSPLPPWSVCNDAFPAPRTPCSGSHAEPAEPVAPAQSTQCFLLGFFCLDLTSHVSTSAQAAAFAATFLAFLERPFVEGSPCACFEMAPVPLDPWPVCLLLYVLLPRAILRQECPRKADRRRNDSSQGGFHLIHTNKIEHGDFTQKHQHVHNCGGRGDISQHHKGQFFSG